jgi:predicted Zn-dependent protease
LLILDEYTFGLNPRPAPLDRALSAAVTATRLAPSSARAQQVLMDVHFARGAIEDAVRAGREALARNPYDPDIMAGLGARYIQLNRPAEGLPLLERAIELSSGRPPWYDFFAFLGAHLMGADKLAQTHAAILLADESPLSLLGRALSYAVAGDEVGAMAAMRRLAEIEPLFPVDGRLYLTRAGFSTAVIDRILADLGPAAAPARP